MNFLRKLSLTRKFLLGVGVIVVFFWAIFSYLIYVYLSEIYKTEAFSKTNLLYQQIQSTMHYIRSDLRPRMFHILPEKEFIKEAMSVSFITKSIMEDFKKKHPNVRYRRVSTDPMNPANMATGRELEYLEMFRQNRKQGFWKGIIEQDGIKYVVHAKPIVMEQECLSCHGRPQDAPEVLRNAYGTSHGFNKQVGDIIGVEYLALPLDRTFEQISNLVMTIFIAGITGMVLMFIAINSLINLVAVRPLGQIRSFFRSVVDGDKGLDAKFEVKKEDEIGELAQSFNRMMDYLRSSQQRLINSERKYRQIFEGSKDAILVADCHGLIQEINQAGVELLGCSDREKVINSRTVQDMFCNMDDYRNFIHRMEVHGFVKDFETRLMTVDGRQVDVLMSANYREDENKNVCGFETIIKDITERKRLIQQVNESERLAAIGQLAAGVAHEINNPLSIIIGYTDLLLDEDSLKELQRKDLQTIRENAHACKKIIEDLLSFSRKKEPVLEECNIHELIESVVTMLAFEFNRKGIEVRRQFDERISVVFIDADKIRQVLLNILMNAYQALDEGGVVETATRLDEDTGTVVITVSDNGPGISEEIRDKIFQPFFTTKPFGQGTGLGLAVSYGLVKEHGGEIEASSNGEGGTTITVKLPLKTEAVREST